MPPVRVGRDISVLIVTLGSFIAGFVNAAFATGGVYILLFSSSSVLPLTAAVPLQTAFAAASLIARVALFWEHIDWRIVRMFFPGCLLDDGIGAWTFAALPEQVIALLLGMVLLLLILMPRLPSLPLKRPFVLTGVVHSYLGSILGVGGVLQPLLLRTDLLKMQLTGTLAAAMLSLDVLKAPGYSAFGFGYLDFPPHIIGATIAGFAGTWAGKRFTHHVSEAQFRRVFRMLVSVVALRFIYKGVSGV